MGVVVFISYARRDTLYAFLPVYYASNLVILSRVVVRYRLQKLMSFSPSS
jgi:hypothetical protein